MFLPFLAPACARSLPRFFFLILMGERLRLAIYFQPVSPMLPRDLASAACSWAPAVMAPADSGLGWFWTSHFAVGMFLSPPSCSPRRWASILPAMIPPWSDRVYYERRTMATDREGATPDRALRR